MIGWVDEIQSLSTHWDDFDDLVQEEPSELEDAVMGYLRVTRGKAWKLPEPVGFDTSLWWHSYGQTRVYTMTWGRGKSFVLPWLVGAVLCELNWKSRVSLCPAADAEDKWLDWYPEDQEVYLTKDERKYLDGVLKSTQRKPFVSYDTWVKLEHSEWYWAKEYFNTYARESLKGLRLVSVDEYPQTVDDTSFLMKLTGDPIEELTPKY